MLWYSNGTDNNHFISGGRTKLEPWLADIYCRSYFLFVIFKLKRINATLTVNKVLKLTIKRPQTLYIVYM